MHTVVEVGYISWNFELIYWPFGFLCFIANPRVLHILTKDKCTLERESDASLSQAGNTTRYLFREKEDLVLKGRLAIQLAVFTLWDWQQSNYYYIPSYCYVEALLADFLVGKKIQRRKHFLGLQESSGGKDVQKIARMWYMQSVFST